MGLFRAAHGWWGGEVGGGERPYLSRMYHTYATISKLGTVIPYVKKIQKLCESRDTHPEFC